MGKKKKKFLFNIKNLKKIEMNIKVMKEHPE